MAARTFPGLGLVGGRTTGEDGWADEMNLNLLTLSVLTQAVINSIVATEPVSPVDGDIHIDTTGWALGTAQDLVARDNGAWVTFTPVEGYLVYDLDTQEYYSFNGTTWAVFTSGAGGSVSVEEDDVEVVAAASTLNFEGAGVSTLDEGAGKVTVTIPGGGTGGAAGVSIPYTETVTEVTDLSTDEVIDISTFDEVRIVLERVQTSTAAAVDITLSSDGSTYESSYPYTRADAGNVEFQGTEAVIELTFASASTKLHDGSARLSGIRDAAQKTYFESDVYTDNYNIRKSAYAAAAAHTHMKLTTGNNALTGGVIRVVGIRYGNTTYLGAQSRSAALTVTNPGVETGDMTGWTAVGNSPVAEARIGGTGTWSSLLGAEWGTYVMAGGSFASSGAYQDIDVSDYSDTAESYTCGSWIAQDDSTTNDVVTVTFELLDVSDSVLQSVSKTLGQSGGTTDTSDLTLPGDPAGVTVRINVDFTRGGSWTYINACADMFSVSANVVEGIDLGVNLSEETASFSVTNAHLYGGGYVDVNSASAVVVTVPPDLFGTQPCVFERVNTGSVTFAAGAGVTINSKDSLLSIADRYTSVTLVPKGSNVYSLQGNLA